jgi:hypothetical protein
MNDIFNGGEENYHVPDGDLRFVPLLEPDPMTNSWQQRRPGLLIPDYHGLFGN